MYVPQFACSLGLLSIFALCRLLDYQETPAQGKSSSEDEQQPLQEVGSVSDLFQNTTNAINVVLHLYCNIFLLEDTASQMGVRGFLQGVCKIFFKY